MLSNSPEFYVYLLYFHVPFIKKLIIFTILMVNERRMRINGKWPQFTHKKSEKESFMVLVNWWLFWHKNKYKCAIDVCFSCQFFCPWQNFIFHWLWFLFVSIARIDNPCHRLQFFVCCKSHFHFAFYLAYFIAFWDIYKWKNFEAHLKRSNDEIVFKIFPHLQTFNNNKNTFYRKHHKVMNIFNL